MNKLWEFNERTILHRKASNHLFHLRKFIRTSGTKLCYATGELFFFLLSYSLLFLMFFFFFSPKFAAFTLEKHPVA